MKQCYATITRNNIDFEFKLARALDVFLKDLIALMRPLTFSSSHRVLSVSDAPWTVLLANIEPESSGVSVGGLIPARSYQFRLCAVNDVGRGQFSKETDRWVLQLLWKKLRSDLDEEIKTKFIREK